MRANRPAVASVLSASAVVGMCMVMSPIAGHPAGWLVSILAALAAGLAVLLASVAWRAYRHHQLSLRLGAAARPASVAQVEVREVAGLESAFVAGLFRPQIYCSPQLAAKLRPEELRAVILHERYHQRIAPRPGWSSSRRSPRRCARSKRAGSGWPAGRPAWRSRLTSMLFSKGAHVGR
jgi:beta-lactamase regulating signal transducer with metallopeptidase domain